LTTLPESIAQLMVRQEVWLERNQLTTMPESIARLAALQELRLDENQPTKLLGAR